MTFSLNVFYLVDRVSAFVISSVSYDEVGYAKIGSDSLHFLAYILNFETNEIRINYFHTVRTFHT